MSYEHKAKNEKYLIWVCSVRFSRQGSRRVMPCMHNTSGLVLYANKGAMYA